MTPIVLASSSPYRRQLLSKLNLDFSCSSSDVDETRLQNETPQDLVLRLSKAKAQKVAESHPGHVVIGSDQVALLGETILGKPGNRETAINQLTAQSAQAVSFYTGLCVLDSATGQALMDMDVCHVHFRALSLRQIQRYLDIEQPYDCAGSFKSEGLGIALFSKIVGEDPNALIGLPLIKLVTLLEQLNVPIL